jgi:hypothetical protein
MTAGDIKGDEAVVIKVTPGETIAKGQLIDTSANGKFFVSAVDGTGKFAVAIEAMTADTDARAVVWGRVEVTATAAAIAAGQSVEAGAAGTVRLAAYGAAYEVAGTAMEDFVTSGTGTIWVGLY